jgi:hypothetical protein
MFSLRDYQETHVAALHRALRGNRSVLDASDTGTGKTFTALSVAKQLGVVPFVVCPKSLVVGWLRAADLVGVPVEVANYDKVRGGTGRKATAERGRVESSSEWGREKLFGKGSQWVWNDPYDLIIFDEVHNCCGSSTLNSKLLIAARRQARHVMGLSASVAESPLHFRALGFALGLHSLKDWPNWVMRNGCRPGVFGGFDFRGTAPVKADVMARLHSQIFPARGARMRRELIPNFPRTQISVAYLPCEVEIDPDLLDIQQRQKLEVSMVEGVRDLVVEKSLTSRVVVFTSFKETLQKLVAKLGTSLGKSDVGFIDGSQTGSQGAQERQAYIDAFQGNRLRALVVNSQAGNAGIGVHDPTGKEDRTTIILPQYSGKILKQILGRAQREGGGFSQQTLLYLDTKKHFKIGLTLEGKLERIDTLNDADLVGSA